MSDVKHVSFRASRMIETQDHPMLLVDVFVDGGFHHVDRVTQAGSVTRFGGAQYCGWTFHDKYRQALEMALACNIVLLDAWFKMSARKCNRHLSKERNADMHFKAEAFEEGFHPNALAFCISES